jgi:exodeoxyribonuclease VII large subunit
MLFAEEDLYTVSQLNAVVRGLVEEGFPDVAVLGEVSNFKRHSSGHLYFTLKDAGAQLRAVCFRGDARRLAADIADGMKVVARGRLTVYEPYGQYQLVAYGIDEAGEGELEKAFRALKEKLEKEGLFAAERKRGLPPFPMRIAVVTSPTGAAVRDILSTLQRRWPCAEVFVLPVHVQGDQAAPEIVRAVGMLGSIEDLDLAILGRGGGSLEDLWAFNEEAVARAIYDCAVPVVSAVGHETDFTIADFVADVRAATPTMAAEIAVPRRDEVLAQIDAAASRLTRFVETQIRLRSTRLQELLRSYGLGRVRSRIESAMQSLDHLTDRLQRSAGAVLKDRRAVLDRMMTQLQALGPAEILSRGYTICTDAATGAILKRAADALEAGTVAITFADGRVRAEARERIDDR